jgi:hypothetical protein
MALSKQLIELDFFKGGDAEQLQNCVEAGRELETLLDDGDKHVHCHRDPASRNARTAFKSMTAGKIA